MDADQEKRILTTTHWIRNEKFRFKGALLPPEIMLKVTKAFMEVAGADGVLSDKERKWIIGYAAATGASPEVIDELEKYQITGLENIIKYFQANSDKPYSKQLQLGLIYGGYQAAAADSELHTKEIAAINNLGRELGVTEENLKQIRALFDEETELREKRSQILFPERR